MEMLGKVRRMYYRDGLSRSEISRRTGLSRNTVRTWLRAPAEKEPRYRRTVQAGKLTPFHAALEQALASAKSEAHRAFDNSAFTLVKAERDALRRAIKTGTIWEDAEGS